MPAVWAGLALFLTAFAPGPALAAGDEGSAVTLSRADCERLLKTKPVAATPEPGVAYQPGVDVRGNTVVGADVDGSPAMAMPDEITFTIGLDLEKKYGIGSTGVFSGEGTVGQIRVRVAGGEGGAQVFWNDQPLDAGDAATVRGACEAAYGAK